MSIMVRLVVFNIFIFSHLAFAASPAHQINKIVLLKENFHEVFENKNANAIPQYFDPEFEEVSNSIHIKYLELIRSIEKMHSSPINFEFRYQDNTFIESGDKLAGRFVFIVKSPNKPPVELDSIFIAQFKNNKLYRFWEITKPDWSELPEFKN